MCGIVGVYNFRGGPVPRIDLERALAVLRHRGPDEEGSFRGGRILLGASRLAIIDPRHGRQPVEDEAGRYHLVMNGEIYDYDHLRAGLEAKGHRLRTRCDTEVGVHLFEELWKGALERIDGQYALAVYDEAEDRLLLARDRTGICPLFYAVIGDWLLFASEAKALFATGLLAPRLRLRALDAVTAFGCVPPPLSAFEGVQVLPAGHCLEVAGGTFRETVYWDIPYPPAGDYLGEPEEALARRLRELLAAACNRRLKADVPVGLYLSGGIDSATVAALVRHAPGVREKAFSIGFPEPGFDESERIRALGRALGLEVKILLYSQGSLSADLPRLVYQAETPLVSTESVALMALSGLAGREVKVVLTGEGSDEALGGYEYFRWEVFKDWLRGAPAGRLPLALLRRRFARTFGARNPFFPLEEDLRWADEVFGFYPAGMVPFFYWRKLRELVYSAPMLERLSGLSDAQLLALPLQAARGWDPLNRSLYVSSRVFLQGHLLAAHGDRALMAHSVEGRYPFLDRAVQEFLAAVPPRLKVRPDLRACTEKYLLRRAMRRELPAEVVRRRKKMFLAPFGTPFVGADATPYLRELLSPGKLAEFGYFNPAGVQRILRVLEGHKAELGRDRGESVRFERRVFERTLYGMALTCVVSTQVLEDQIRSGRFSPEPAALRRAG